MNNLPCDTINSYHLGYEGSRTQQSGGCSETIHRGEAKAILYVTVLGGFAGLAWLGLFSEKVTLHT